MSLTPPTEEDLELILMELDDNFDGSVDKDEFLKLVMLVMAKMVESEHELQGKVKQEQERELLAQFYDK